MQCKRCSWDIGQDNLEIDWWKTGVVFRLVCHNPECGCYYQSQIAQNGHAYKKKDKGIYQVDSK